MVIDIFADREYNKAKGGEYLMKIVQAHNYFKNDTPYAALHINSCGYFSEIDCATGVCRRNGRADYQIICILKGKMHAEINGSRCELSEGQAIIFKPGEPQIYGCSPQSDSAYYWIHFGGEATEQLLRECGLYEKNCFDVGEDSTDIEMIFNIMAEINQKSVCYQLRLAALFTELLTGLARRVVSEVGTQRAARRVYPAIEAMESDTNIQYTVSDYAEMCLMSKYYFLHEFKKVTGRTPMQYKCAVSLEKARCLLRETELPIKEIANTVGIPNPLYFGKKFKARFGVPPAAYRRRFGNASEYGGAVEFGKKSE